MKTRAQSTPAVCPACKGRKHTGELEKFVHENGQTYERLKPCPGCNGRGTAAAAAPPAVDARSRAAGERE